ncbi:hypothetical protein [Paraglaciecola aestuariivivens]
MQWFKSFAQIKPITLVWTVFFVYGFSACIQSNAVSSTEEPSALLSITDDVSDNTLKVVNAAFYEKFVLGDWHYKGAKSQGGEVNAYIKIPAPLEMATEVQKAYLEQIMCPSSLHKNMWKQLSHTPLSIHIYTNKPKDSFYVYCENPYTNS